MTDNLIKPFSDHFREYLADESRLSGRAEFICFPHCEKEISLALQEASSRRSPVTVSGGKTGITGGAVPQCGIVLSLEKMNRILGLGYDAELNQWSLRMEPGALIRDIEQALYRKDFPDLENTSTNLEKASLEKFLNSDTRLFYPPDPTETTAQIGGTVACNASGARTLGFGATREYVRKLRIALPSGEIIEMPRGKYFANDRGIMEFKTASGKLSIPVPGYSSPPVKNAAGYYSTPGMDLIDLFIGSEGTLGVFTEIEISAIPAPPFILGAVIFLSSMEDAVRFVHLIRGETDSKVSETSRPHALEYIGSSALDILREKRKNEGSASPIPPLPDSAKAVIYYERLYDQEESGDEICQVLERALARVNATLDDTWAEFDSEGVERIRAFRHAVPETVNSMIAQIKSKYPNITKLGTDFAVPNDMLGDMLNFYHKTLDKARLRYMIFGHIGDNHLHVNIIPNDEDEYERGKKICEDLAREAIRLGGTVSAEHGIGKLKKNLLRLMIGEKGVLEMRKIKQILDPGNILNQGNLF